MTDNESKNPSAEGEVNPLPPVVRASDNIRCDHCNRMVFQRYAVVGAGDDVTKQWFHCACGLIFNLHTPDLAKVFTEEYRKKYLDLKEIALRYDYYIRTYAPLIEERTYGRRFLDVGFCTDFIIKGMEARGWIAAGIDLIPHPDYTTGDFETIPTNGIEGTVDCIWLGDVLQCFKDPLAAIQKCYRLLKPTGMLFLVTPDTDLLRMGRFSDFGHWDLEQNRRYYSGRQIVDMLEHAAPSPKEGRFDVILKLHNFSQRYPSWNNLHLIAQKEAFDR